MGSLTVLSKVIDKETNVKNREISGKKIDQALEETSKALCAKIKADGESLSKDINKVQVLSLGTPLAFIDDPKERKVAHARLEAFGACVRRRGWRGLDQGYVMIDQLYV